ncbi:MAG: helix-turn-helix transcriptional regulator [Alphaproteobacteria bacterium]|nr:helix-turn-helix transcriptional regulator [Alphaproteobacteria bacterium]
MIAAKHDDVPQVADMVDIHVGRRLRMRRTLLGLTQQALGMQLGLTFQQIQKYECGANRISSSRLFLLGQALQVPVSYFFDGLPREMTGGSLAKSPERKMPAVPPPAESLEAKETLDLVRNFYRITDPAVRQGFFDTVVTIAETQSSPVDAPPGPPRRRVGRPPGPRKAS